MLFGFQKRKALLLHTFPFKESSTTQASSPSSLNSNHWINVIEFSDFEFVVERNCLEGYLATSSTSGNVKIWIVIIKLDKNPSGTAATTSSANNAPTMSLIKSCISVGLVDTLFPVTDRRIPQLLRFATVPIVVSKNKKNNADELETGVKSTVKMCAVGKSGSITVWTQPDGNDFMDVDDKELMEQRENNVGGTTTSVDTVAIKLESLSGYGGIVWDSTYSGLLRVYSIDGRVYFLSVSPTPTTTEKYSITLLSDKTSTMRDMLLNNAPSAGDDEDEEGNQQDGEVVGGNDDTAADAGGTGTTNKTASVNSAEKHVGFFGSAASFNGIVDFVLFK